MSQLHALIVDDDPFMVRLIETLITRKFADQFRFDITSDSTEARSLVELNRYDLVFTDVEMPYVDGMEIVRRALQHNARTRVVVITGHSTPARIDAALELGASDYLVKPINPGMLHEIVGQYLAQRQRWQQAVRETLDAR